MLIASAVCILMLSAYLFLFVLREKRTVGLMISLGAGQRYTMRKMFVISMIPVVVATVVGTAVGMLLTSGVLNTIYMDAVQEAEISEEPAVHITAAIRTFPLIGSVLYLAVYAFFVWLTVRLLTKKSPLELLKAKV